MYSGVPFAPAAIADPVELPWQSTSVLDEIEAERAMAGSEIVAEVVVVQLWLSVIVTKYVPAANPVEAAEV